MRKPECQALADVRMCSGPKAPSTAFLGPCARLAGKRGRGSPKVGLPESTAMQGPSSVAATSAHCVCVCAMAVCLQWTAPPAKTPKTGTSSLPTWAAAGNNSPRSGELNLPPRQTRTHKHRILPMRRPVVHANIVESICLNAVRGTQTRQLRPKTILQLNPLCTLRHQLLQIMHAAVLPHDQSECATLATNPAQPPPHSHKSPPWSTTFPVVRPAMQVEERAQCPSGRRRRAPGTAVRPHPTHTVRHLLPVRSTV